MSKSKQKKQKQHTVSNSNTSDSSVEADILVVHGSDDDYMPEIPPCKQQQIPIEPSTLQNTVPVEPSVEIPVFEKKCVQSEDKVTLSSDEYALLSEYRKQNLVDILKNLDIDSETKMSISQLWIKLSWIEDSTYTAFIAAVHNEWNIAYLLVDAKDNQLVNWKLLRMLLGNWGQFRDRRQLKELCIHIMQQDEKAMPKLNQWAIDFGKAQGKVFKGYCDLCSGDNKAFAMQYSEL